LSIVSERSYHTKNRKKLLKIIPRIKGRMISEIELFNKAYYKYNIKPTKTYTLLRELIREGFVYEPRDGYYRKV
jgi:hypothetical protein